MFLIVFTILLVVLLQRYSLFSYFFFFNDTATTEIYTLSLHDALPISSTLMASTTVSSASIFRCSLRRRPDRMPTPTDRKSTRLNSSHSQISYAVFCLKKKKYTRIHSSTDMMRYICYKNVDKFVLMWSE